KQRPKRLGPSSPSRVKESLAICDVVSTWLNSASIEGRSDGLLAIHIPRCRHRRCDVSRTHRGTVRDLLLEVVGSTHRSPPAMPGQVLRPRETFHGYLFRRVSLHKSNVDASAFTTTRLSAPQSYSHTMVYLSQLESLGVKLRSVMRVTISRE